MPRPGTDAVQRRFDLLALGDPVLDVVVHADALPGWDDKRLGREVQWLPGGSETNAVCAASRLGLRCAVFGSVGGGSDGELLCSDLAAFGVVTAHLQRRPGQASATAVVFVSPQGERAITYTPAPQPPDRHAELQALLPQVRCVYALPYDPAAFTRVAQAAQVCGTQVAVDIERAVAAVPGALAALCAGSDLMCFNEAGFREATGQAATLDNAAAFLGRTRAHTVAVSLGAAGALAVGRDGQRAHQTAYTAKVIDTTGAGDCFNGALVAGLLQGLALQAALMQACAAASLCVEGWGARSALPTPEQVRQRLLAARRPRGA